MQAKINFPLMKNEGHDPSGLGNRLIVVISRQAVTQNSCSLYDSAVFYIL